MRTIRFRAYYKPEKRMIYDIQNEFEERIELGMNCFADYLNNDDFVVEQDTGLKDKNGESIWEGDILMDDTGEPIEYWVVKFSDGGFVGECIGIIENLFELTHLEIVGNINDDSELLEEK